MFVAKKFQLVGAITAVGLGLMTTAAPSSADQKPKPNKFVEVQILSFNDYHGWLEPPTGADATLGAALDPTLTTVGGGEYLATTLKALRTPNSITATAGDLIGGTPFLSGLFHDEPSVESLESMGLDVSSVGNHEFDEGLTELLRMRNGGCHPKDGCYFPEAPYDGSSFPWLAANVTYSNGRTVLPGTWVKEVAGVKVGFIGMTLEATPLLVAQSGIQGLTFGDEILAANKAVKELKKRKVKTIIVLIHEGGLQTGTYQGCSGISGPIVDVNAGIDDDVDMVISGHTHQPYNCLLPGPEGELRPVTSASSFGRVVTDTRLIIKRSSGKVERDRTTSTNVLVSRSVAKDPAQTAIIDKWKALSGPIAGRPVGTITANITRSPGRNTESSLANLIADAQLAATDGPTEGGAQIALMNPGGVRADLTFAATATVPGDVDGRVTFGEAFNVQPFGNLLVTMDLTGAQLDTVLEQQAVLARPGGREVLILGVSKGLTFDYATAGPFGARVANIALNGVAISPTATYRVTVNSFLADGGDSFAELRNGTNRLGGGEDLPAFNAYLEANSPVSPPATDRINEL